MEAKISSLPSQICRRFSLDEILSATQNFDDAFVVGEGGFGKVYKATIKLENGESFVVAVKRLDSNSDQGAPEFWAEVEMLTKLRHCNLVSLIGYCNDNLEMILIYEFMPNGTLDGHLNRYGTSLSWIQRLNISIGAARGLQYLHTGTGTQHGVIHRDVKSTNILLDADYAAKISDFGLSKIGPINASGTYVNTLIRGTFGYLDPEYFLTGRLTRKSDVFAFGVVLFELLCGRAALDKSLDEDECSLAKWAYESIKGGKVSNIIDQKIKSQISLKSLKVYVEIAYRCLSSESKKRPTMAEIVVALELSLAHQNKSYNHVKPALGMLAFARIMKHFFISPEANSDQSDKKPTTIKEDNAQSDKKLTMMKENTAQSDKKQTMMKEDTIEVPGFRFHPTDEELICHYLRRKVSNSKMASVIGEVNLNKVDPWELPAMAQFGDREWYFFYLRDGTYQNGSRTFIATTAGYWEARGENEEIYNGKSLVGMKIPLIFYKGTAQKGKETNWAMHAYRLDGKYSANNLAESAKGEWVLSKVFKKNSSVLEEPGSSFSEAADDDPLPAVESLQISGEAFPGRELQASGYSVNGTTSVCFEWVRHMEDGSISYIDGAKQPTYLVTADDVDTYLAIEVQPIDHRKRKGELLKVFANEHRKIGCDSDMHDHIKKAIQTGYAEHRLSLHAGYLDIYEPVTLVIKKDGITIKAGGTPVNEKFYPTTIVSIPYGYPVEFSIIGLGSIERRFRVEQESAAALRDTIVLTMRYFIKQAVAKKKGLFF